ncbi:DUF302 domain-containing protein [Devosia alba]|uniref:DUF302 domain-containing protein n=1 Tax=Devosia alba TaxID=3152360 RepID=UPI00326778D7
MYTFDKTLTDTTFEAAIAHTKQALAAKGFGILTEIDVQKTMKTKLDETMPGYAILGACNPKMAFEALKLEPRVGAMLPCNVIVRELADGSVEVSAIDPVASMSAIENAELHGVAGQVRQMLSDVMASL